MPRSRRRSARRLAALAAGPLLFAPAASAQEAGDGDLPILSADAAPLRLSGSIEPAAATTTAVTTTAAAAADPAAAMTVPPADATAPLRAGRTAPLTLQNLLARAVSHSAQIRVFAELPEIRRTSITEADAAFDWHTFAEGRWDDVSDPVGNTLTTGGAERFEDHHVAGSTGLRRRNRFGGRVEAAQRLGWQDTNSTFFLPAQQGTTRLSLSYTHPLMRGTGLAYNTALTVLAQIDTGVATDEFHRQLQSHLLEVTRAYWGLSLERSVLVQKRASLARAEEIARRLTLRREIDAVASQIARADAAVAARRADLVRSEAAVRNAEGRVRALVNDPALGGLGGGLGAGGDVELIPTDVPSEQLIPVSVPAAVEVAIRHRPEISQSMRQIRAACVRCDMSENELLPVLNLVTEGYVSGLRGQGDVAQSFGDQFSAGRPSYSVGLQFEMPLGNRVARARNARRRMELRQLRNQYRTTLETLSLEVEVAARELQTAGLEMDAKREAKRAAEVQLDYVAQRWVHLPGEGGTASLVLESLLDAQDRLAEAEVGLLTSRITYNLAMTELKRATGELLTSEQVTIGTANIDCLPTAVLDKPELSGGPRPAGLNGPGFGPIDAPPPPAPPASDAAPGFAPPPAPVAPLTEGGVLPPARLPRATAPAAVPAYPHEATAPDEPSVRRTAHSGGSAQGPAPKRSFLGKLFGGDRR